MSARRSQKIIDLSTKTERFGRRDTPTSCANFSTLAATPASGATIGKWSERVCRLCDHFVVSFSDRYDEQVTVWYDDEATSGAIAPAIGRQLLLLQKICSIKFAFKHILAPAGTITRRAVRKFSICLIMLDRFSTYLHCQQPFF